MTIQILKPTPHKLAYACMFLVISLIYACSGSSQNTPGDSDPTKVSFYEVPMVCNADTTVGCGSRIKPVFIEAAKHERISEAWTNRRGTVLAFVWKNMQPDFELVEKIFAQFNIDYTHLIHETDIAPLLADFKQKEKWFKGMDVDLLSLHEAETIANNSTTVVENAGYINKSEATKIRQDVASYFKKELVVVRSTEELERAGTEKWIKGMYEIYASHVGDVRADSIRNFYSKYLGKKIEEQRKHQEGCQKGGKKSCCKK